MARNGGGRGYVSNQNKKIFLGLVMQEGRRYMRVFSCFPDAKREQGFDNSAQTDC